MHQSGLEKKDEACTDARRFALMEFGLRLEMQGYCPLNRPTFQALASMHRTE